MSGYDITQIPIWFVKADNDPVCTSYTSKILYNVFKEMGAKKNKISMYTNEEMSAYGLLSLHSSWIMAFNDPEIIKWIYNQSK
jgi:predicted peptidase